ncbi:PhzF family phenazine biosynthesis protein [Bacillus timonensis]|nr:PhzF family phenazine biosynthesis protein [Bacillus timonensis]
MRQIKVFHVDAFTSEPFGGNPAGVVLDGDKLSVAEMQKVASELNLPESVFMLKTNHPEADVKVRYFTPKEEIDFCGHATVGLAWILAEKLGWTEKMDTVKFETNIGLVPVKWNKENGLLQSVEMTQITPKVKEIEINLEHLSSMIGIPAYEINDQFPIKLANTGNWHLIVPIKNQRAIDSAKPRLDELSEFNRLHNVSTTHLFTFETTESGYDVYTRDFAPAVGIPEDPVTGSANGAMAGYFALEEILEKDKTHHLTIAQGHAFGRPGTLYASIEPGPIIKIAGSAVITIEGILQLK